MITSIMIKTCTPNLNTLGCTPNRNTSASSQCTSTGEESAPSPVLVAVGSKQKSDVFLAVLFPCQKREDSCLQWHKMECAEQGRLEW